MNETIERVNQDGFGLEKFLHVRKSGVKLAIAVVHDAYRQEGYQT